MIAEISLEQAYAHCAAVTQARAVNFRYAFALLPADQRRAIEAVYAFSRLCDDGVDDPPPGTDPLSGLAACRQRLEEAYLGRAQDPVFVALGDTVRRFRISRTYFEELISGCEMDVGVRRYEDFEALWIYAYRVASVVGLIVIEILGYDAEVAREHAIDLGIAMQLTNILRDVKEDAERDRIYLPQAELRQFGVSEADLRAGIVNEPFRRLMAFQIDRARDIFRRGERLLPHLPRRSRPCPAVLRLLYGAVLRKIERRGYDVFTRRVSLSTPQKVWLALRGLLAMV